MDKEIWKPIVGYEGLYSVSNLGRVRSEERMVRCNTSHRKIRQRILVPKFRKGKYFFVSLAKENSVKPKSIHVAVAEAFIGPRPEGFHVCHFDGCKYNNSLNNLRYDTASANFADRVRHGRGPIFRGENAISAKHSDAKVAAIRSATGSQSQIAKEFGVSQSYVSAVKAGKKRALA